MIDSTNLNHVVDFLFETGILSKTPRSGFHFLGSGKQSVAEHINRVVFIGYVLATAHEMYAAHEISAPIRIMNSIAVVRPLSTSDS